MALNFRKFIEGLRIVPKGTLTQSGVQKGDLQVKDDADGKLYYNNGSDSNSAGSPIVTEDYSATLTNKTLTTPIVNTSLTGGVSGSLTVQSGLNQNLTVQSQGTGNVSIQSSGSDGVTIESIKVNSNIITGGAGSELKIESDASQDLILSSNYVVIGNTGGETYLNTYLNVLGPSTTDSIFVSSNDLFGPSGFNFQIQSGNNRNLLLYGAGSGAVDISSLGNLLIKSVAGTVTSKVLQTSGYATPNTAPTHYTVSVDIDSIAASASKFIIITNVAASAIKIANDVGTLSTRIKTGTGSAIYLNPNASLILVNNASYWHVLGNSSGLFTDSGTTLVASTDSTKQIKFDVSGSTGTSTTLLSSQTANRILTLPDITDTLVGTATSDTLTNKTLTTPIINTSITGGTGSSLTVQSATNQNLVLQAPGTGTVLLSDKTAFSRSSASFSSFTLTAPTTTYVDIDSVISTIEMISSTGVADGQILILTNRSGSPITIKELTGATSSQQIVTGASSDIDFSNTASLILVYNTGSAKWHVVGGTQPIISTTSVSSISSSTTLTNADDVVLVTTGASTSQTFLSTDVTTGASGGFNKVNHGFTSLQPITISSTGTLPGGLSAGTVYYVRYQNTDFFSVTTSPNDPFATPINITSQGTGTHTVTAFGLVVTLPSPLSGKKFDIKKIDSASGAVSVIGPSGTTIDGFNNRFILNQNDSITFVSNGTNYFII